MGRPVTFLEGLSEHALSFGAASFEVRPEDGFQRVYAQVDGEVMRFGNYKRGDSTAKELLEDLATFARKPRRAVLGGQLYTLHVQASDKAADTFAVVIEPVPRRDPSIAPEFTAKQGQYLAFIYHYSKAHREAPAESDIQYYFRVSPPAIHDMIKTLERNGLIERTAGKARSIRLLVRSDHIPHLR